MILRPASEKHLSTSIFPLRFEKEKGWYELPNDFIFTGRWFTDGYEDLTENSVQKVKARLFLLRKMFLLQVCHWNFHAATTKTFFSCF